MPTSGEARIQPSSTYNLRSRPFPKTQRTTSKQPSNTTTTKPGARTTKKDVKNPGKGKILDSTKKTQGSNRTVNKVRKVPDFNKLHNKWKKQLEVGKSCSKKPCTQIQEFDLTKPGTRFQVVDTKEFSDEENLPEEDNLDFELDQEVLDSLMDGKISDEENGDKGSTDHGRKEKQMVKPGSQVIGTNSPEARKEYLNRPVLGVLSTDVTNNQENVTRQDCRSAATRGSSDTENVPSNVNKKKSLIDQQKESGLEFEMDGSALASILNKKGIDMRRQNSAASNNRQTIATASSHRNPATVKERPSIYFVKKSRFESPTKAYRDFRNHCVQRLTETGNIPTKELPPSSTLTTDTGVDFKADSCALASILNNNGVEMPKRQAPALNRQTIATTGRNKTTAPAFRVERPSIYYKKPKHESPNKAFRNLHDRFIQRLTITGGERQATAPTGQQQSIVGQDSPVSQTSIGIEQFTGAHARVQQADGKRTAADSAGELTAPRRVPANPKTPRSAGTALRVLRINPKVACLQDQTMSTASPTLPRRILKQASSPAIRQQVDHQATPSNKGTTIKWADVLSSPEDDAEDEKTKPFALILNEDREDASADLLNQREEDLQRLKEMEEAERLLELEIQQLERDNLLQLPVTIKQSQFPDSHQTNITGQVSSSSGSISSRPEMPGPSAVNVQSGHHQLGFSESSHFKSLPGQAVPSTQGEPSSTLGSLRPGVAVTQNIQTSSQLQQKQQSSIPADSLGLGCQSEKWNVLGTNAQQVWHFQEASTTTHTNQPTTLQFAAAEHPGGLEAPRAKQVKQFKDQESYNHVLAPHQRFQPAAPQGWLPQTGPPLNLFASAQQAVQWPFKQETALPLDQVKEDQQNITTSGSSVESNAETVSKHANNLSSASSSGFDLLQQNRTETKLNCPTTPAFSYSLPPTSTSTLKSARWLGPSVPRNDAYMKIQTPKPVIPGKLNTAHLLPKTPLFSQQAYIDIDPPIRTPMAMQNAAVCCNSAANAPIPFSLTLDSPLPRIVSPRVTRPVAGQKRLLDAANGYVLPRDPETTSVAIGQQQEVQPNISQLAEVLQKVDPPAQSRSATDVCSPPAVWSTADSDSNVTIATEYRNTDGAIAGTVKTSPATPAAEQERSPVSRGVMQRGSLSLGANLKKKSPKRLDLKVPRFTLRGNANQLFHDALLDEEVALYTCRLLGKFGAKPSVDRDFGNPIARVLEEGDAMHFIPVKDESVTQGITSGSAFSVYPL